MSSFFFFNDTATTEIYTLPYTTLFRSRLAAIGFAGRLYVMLSAGGIAAVQEAKDFPIRMIESGPAAGAMAASDRKSTRLNSSHLVISYAVFCLKKKKEQHRPRPRPLRQ